MEKVYNYLSRAIVFLLLLLLLSTLLLADVSSIYTEIATVGVPDSSGTPGDTIVIPIRINNAAGLGVISADITLSFDPNILTADSASLGNAVPTDTLRLISLIKSNPTAGQIKIAVASAYPISEDGDLVTVHFVVSEYATSGDSCSIHFAECKLNEGNINSIAEDGLFVVTPTFSISGYVRYYSNDSPIDSSIVSLHPQVTETDINGYYTFSKLAGYRDYTVILDRTNPTWDEAVSPFDAACVIYYIAGHINLSEGQQIAADVSGNDLISSWDAALILQHAAQVIDSFPVGNWTFAPEIRGYDSLSSNLTNQDYRGILYGDISGNWCNSVVLLKGRNIAGNEKLIEMLPATTTALVSVPNVTGVPGNSVAVPINISNASNVVATGIVLAYDNSVLTPNNVSITSFTSNYLIVYKVNDGQVRIALAGATPLNGSGSLVNITFDVADTASDSSPLSLNLVDLNEGNVPCKISSGTFTIVNAGITDGYWATPHKFALLGNSPNPFNQQTIIEYSIGPCGQLRVSADDGQQSMISLRIYDGTGRLVRSLVSETQKAGCYEVMWDGRDGVGRKAPNGVYFCQLRTKNYVDTKKIALLR